MGKPKLQYNNMKSQDTLSLNHPCYARRKFLHNSLVMTGSSLAFSLPSLAAAQSPQIQAQTLSNKALLVQGPNSNVLAMNSDEGVIMIDGGHSSWFNSLHQSINQAFPNQPIRALFNTHWHRDQTGSNETLGTQGVEIFSHENTKLWLGTEIWQRWSDITFSPLPNMALPKTVFLNSDSVELAEHKLQIKYLHNAHTDGDIAVYFEEENILVCGGLVSMGRWPILDWWTGGYTGGMLESFGSLLAVPNEDTQIIPAYGEVMTLRQLKDQNRMYTTIINRLHDLYTQSNSLKEILAAKPTAEFDTEMGDPTQFITLAYQSIQGHLRDPQNFRLLNIP